MAGATTAAEAAALAAAIIADAEEAVAGSTATGAVIDVGGLLGMTWLVTVTAAGALVAMLAPVGTIGATTPLAKLGAGEAKHTNVSTCNDTRAANNGTHGMRTSFSGAWGTVASCVRCFGTRSSGEASTCPRR